MWVIQRVQNIVFGAGDEIIQTNVIVVVTQHTLAQMLPEKAGSTDYERAWAVGVVFYYELFPITFFAKSLANCRVKCRIKVLKLKSLGKNER